ncbi:hypothetical protein UFOVP783_31 [uncultured Caudovirales phage]|uniref:DUF6378 domain-containing protein n=1 Tax=uncultured Caudovirales phage TaxID=2100421 RepID=A0A6J5P475_9CAUD|nr:hypothetical protein UFOVP783_31 [uncultured Caudovirales phage]
MKPSSSSSSESSASGPSYSGTVLVARLYPTGEIAEEPGGPAESGGVVIGTIQESGGEPITGESGGLPVTGESGGVPILQAVQLIPASPIRFDAAQLLRDAAATLEARGVRYDSMGKTLKERSMEGIVERFQAATGIKLTPAQGYHFMGCLKEERIERDPNGYDNYVDLLAYAALQVEATHAQLTPVQP